MFEWRKITEFKSWNNENSENILFLYWSLWPQISCQLKHIWPLWQYRNSLSRVGRHIDNVAQIQHHYQAVYASLALCSGFYILDGAFPMKYMPENVIKFTLQNIENVPYYWKPIESIFICRKKNIIVNVHKLLLSFWR